MAIKLKLLILLVALVALPLRGMAAVAMWHCAQDQHEESALAEGHDNHAPQDGHGHESGAHDDHDGHEAGNSHSHAGDVAADGDPAASQGSPTASSCSACAACCVGGAVVPAAWTSFSPEPPGAGVIAFVERGFTGVVPAQLDRPPLARHR